MKGAKAAAARVGAATWLVINAATAQPEIGESVSEDVAEEWADDSPWVVIVWNDPVNLMSYVTYVFNTLLGHPRPVAEKLMLDVHEKGKATVALGTRPEMELTVSKLHAAGLWATMAQDR